MPLQAAVLDRPDRSVIFCKPDDGRFRNQQRLRQPRRGDVNLGLLAEIKGFRHLFISDLDPPLLVDAIAFGLDAGNLAAQALAGMRAQDDVGRLADPDLAGLALVDKGEHPDRFRIDEREHWLAASKGGAEFLKTRGHHGVVRSRKGVKI